MHIVIPDDYQHVVETLAQSRMPEASGRVDVASIRSYLGISAD